MLSGLLVIIPNELGAVRTRADADQFSRASHLLATIESAHRRAQRQENVSRGELGLDRARLSYPVMSAPLGRVRWAAPPNAGAAHFDRALPAFELDREGTSDPVVLEPTFATCGGGSLNNGHDCGSSSLNWSIQV
jgi:hypothetical protein